MRIIKLPEKEYLVTVTFGEKVVPAFYVNAYTVAGAMAVAHEALAWPMSYHTAQ